jgi:hypothetical protein
MGSTTQRCGVYGGEYTLIGLRLFAWWKKNGERRLQKADSGSAAIRSRPPVGRPLSLIGVALPRVTRFAYNTSWSKPTARSHLHCLVRSHRAMHVRVRPIGQASAGVPCTTRSIDAIWCVACSLDFWPKSTRPNLAWAHQQARRAMCVAGLLHSIDGVSRCSLAASAVPFFSSSFSFYLFLLNK